MATALIDYHPNEGQLRFHQSTAKYKLACSGVGGGKSAAGAIEKLERCLVNPGPSMVLCPTYDLLRLNTLPPIMKWWPPGIVRNWSQLETIATSRNPQAFDLHLTNGHPVYFRTASEPDNLRGPNLTDAWMDEPGQMPEWAWKVLIGRIRVPCKLPGIFGTTTPKGFNWLYRKFGPNKPGADYECITWNARQNASNLREGYHDDLIRDYSTAEAMQEVEGQFVDVSSDSYLDVQQVRAAQRSGLPHMPKDEHRMLHLGIDVGRKHDLTVVWGLFEIGDTLHTGVLRELRNVPYDTQRRIISGIMPKVSRCCIDSTGIGDNLAEDLNREWGDCVEPITFTVANKASLAAGVKKWLSGGFLRIPDDASVLSDLMAVGKVVTSTGAVRLHAERSEDGHADRFWALALAIHAYSAYVPVTVSWG